MTNGNDLAFNDTSKSLMENDGYGNQKVNPSLSKREYFAAMATVSDEELNLHLATTLMGEIRSGEIAIESIKWWAAAEAKLRVIKADALIAALNETHIKGE